MTTNAYCDLRHIFNEADVEQSFVRRLLEDLGFSDKEIRPKTSLDKLKIGGMRNLPQKKYKPDFAIVLGSEIKLIIEAKAPSEDISLHEWQPRAYCMALNGEFKGKNPTEYFVITNALKTTLFKHDSNYPEIELDFSDFVHGNKKFEKFIAIFKALKSKKRNISNVENHIFVKPSIAEVNAAFSWCHQHIYKKDNISQADAFTEFVKLISLKLLSDRQIKEIHADIISSSEIIVPASDVYFSSQWIEENSKTSPNPIDQILFKNFIDKMEIEIASGVRKRIFDKDDKIKLKSETVSGVVKRLENLFLFGIDADLNGRLFETFLNATMRGKDLGQFFTPRSLVKLGIKLAQLKVHSLASDGTRHTDIVLDACCGTGGFLIDVLAEMWSKVNDMQNISATDQDIVKKKIANEQIIGIDVGNGPNLSRVARLNMYLHGDGGTRIFHVDALDKVLAKDITDSPEIIVERNQLKEIFSNGNCIDVVLTNPPFAKTYEDKTESEKKILSSYEIGRTRKSLKSSLMFIERYYDLLKPGGKLVTIIDDGILSGDGYSWFRTYIRKKFIIKAIISLPGDAFQRSKARVKTSFLVAEKKRFDSQEQPNVFMYPCRYVGIDDPSRQRTLPIDAENRQKAISEINDVGFEFNNFSNGNGDLKYTVSQDRIQNRLNVKHCLMKSNSNVPQWKNNNFDIFKLKDVMQEKIFCPDDIIETKDNDDFVTLLIVRYEGLAEAGQEIIASETLYPHLYRVRTGDIVISNIAASYGSMAVIPEDLDGCVVSPEYTVLEAISPHSPEILQLILRSPVVRSEILLASTGISRTRMRWDKIKNISFPMPEAKAADKALEQLKQARSAVRAAKIALETATNLIESPLDLNNESAKIVLVAFKPPK